MKITPRFVRDRTLASRRVPSRRLARIHHSGNRLSFLDNDMRTCAMRERSLGPERIFLARRSLYPAKEEALINSNSISFFNYLSPSLSPEILDLDTSS